MSNQKIVAIRADWDEVGKVYKGLSRMNQKLSQTLRKAANIHGVKQTMKIERRPGYSVSQRLEFYFMDEEQFNELNDEQAEFFAKLSDQPYLMPQLVIDDDELIKVLGELNNRPGYGGRMKNDVFRQYKKDLLEAMAGIMTLVNLDPERKRKEPKKVKFADISGKFNVGDIIGFREGTHEVIKVNTKSIRTRDLLIGYEQLEKFEVGDTLPKVFN